MAADRINAWLGTLASIATLVALGVGVRQCQLAEHPPPQDPVTKPLPVRIVGDEAHHEIAGSSAATKGAKGKLVTSVEKSETMTATAAEPGRGDGANASAATSRARSGKPTSSGESSPMAIPAPAVHSWSLTPMEGLAASVIVTSLQPNDLHRLNSTKNGFRVVLTLRPGEGIEPSLLLPLKGGRIGPFFRLINAAASTSEGTTCSGWTSADEFPMRYWIDTDRVPVPDTWTRLTAPMTFIMSYWCDAPLAVGDDIDFSFSLYVSGKKSTWAISGVPVRSDRGRLS